MSVSDIMVLCFIHINILLIVCYVIHNTTYKTAYKKGFDDGYKFGKVDGKAEVRNRNDIHREKSL